MLKLSSMSDDNKQHDNFACIWSLYLVTLVIHVRLYKPVSDWLINVTTGYYHTEYVRVFPIGHK